MDLPGELRNVIYAYALVLDHPIDLGPRTTVYEGDRHTLKQQSRNRSEVVEGLAVSLLRGSKLISSEAAPIFYGQNTFAFTDEGGWVILEAFLYTVESANRKSIAKVTVNFVALMTNRARYRREKRYIVEELRTMRLHIPYYSMHVHKYDGRNLDPRVEGHEGWAKRIMEARESLAKMDTMCVLEKDAYEHGLDYFNRLTASIPGLQISLVFVGIEHWAPAASEQRQQKVREACGYGWNVWMEEAEYGEEYG